MKKPTLLFFFALVSFFPALAGSHHKIDSLKNALAHQQDTSRVLTLIKLSQAYYPVNDDTALLYAQMLRKEAEAWGNRVHICDAYTILGTALHHKSLNDSAISCKYRAIAIGEAGKYKKGIANAASDLGLYLKDEGEMDSALKYTLLGATLREEINDEKQLAISYTNLGYILSSIGENGKAVDYFHKALPIFTKYNQAGNYAQVLNNIASLYDDAKRYDTALIYYRRSLAIRDSIGDEEGVSQSLLNIGVLYRNSSDYVNAEKYLGQALAIKRKLGAPSVPIAMLDLAQAYRFEKKFTSALPLLQSADSLASKNDKELKRDIYFEFSNLYADMKKFDLALLYREKYEKAKEEIFNDLKLKVIDDMQTKYQTEKKEKDNIALQAKHKSDAIELERKQNQEILLSSGIAVLVIILGLSVFAYRVKIRSERRIAKQNQSLRELNKKLIESEEELVSLNATKDKLFSVISHDLSNPVRAVSNYTQAVLAQKNSMQRDELLASFEKLDHSVQPLQGFLDNLLQWSSLQRMGISVKEEDFSVKEVVAEVTALHAAYAALKKVKITTDVNDALALRTDQNLFRLVLRNLVSNAIKFSPVGSEVKIYAEKNDASVCVGVQDKGAGISNEKIEALRSGKPVTSEKGTMAESGTGLGLSLVQEYISKMNGKLFIESEPGKGSLFRAEFSLAQR